MHAHRIYTLNDNLHVTNIISQRCFLAFLYEHIDLFEKLERASLLGRKVLSVDAAQMSQQHSRVMYVSPSTCALDVFCLMERTKRRFLPIINSSKQLEGCVSSSDFLKLEQEQYHLLYAPISAYLEALRSRRAPATIDSHASFSAVIQKMHEQNVHHLCVMEIGGGNVEKFSNVCGIVDVLGVLLDAVAPGARSS
eukprot:TRINITY_DN3403_c0_g1_i1.p1 TRINITY_DN3403_c0_g1~~TRINITY_DN3403_c0_g1_i1.p1  ORF type:complete len:195 (-),score=19.46 TRINITY_DN3403_c0_g1_i1:216-800(-)